MKLIKTAVGAALVGTAAAAAIAAPAAAVYVPQGTSGCVRAYASQGQMVVYNGCGQRLDIKVKASCQYIAYFREFRLEAGQTRRGDKANDQCKFFVWVWR